MDLINLLIIEDDEANALLLKRHLGFSGRFNTTCVEKAEDALTLINQNQKNDLILCDYNLPGMNGIDFIKEYRAAGNNSPIVMMTAVGNEEIAVSAIKAGAEDYTPKYEGYEFNIPKLLIDALQSNRLKRALEEANREREEFLSIVSHDLRSPIGFCKTTGSLLLEENYGALNNEQKNLIKKIVSQTDSCLELISTLLEATAIEGQKLELNRQAFSLNELLEKSIETSKSQIARDVSIIKKGFDSNFTIKADYSRLLQVFNNIISNAAKFVNPGGYIIIEIQLSGNSIAVSIENSGSGIPKDKFNVVFNKYSQLKYRAKGGVGLGLYIAKKLVEMHNGRIWVDSDGTGYTRFYISIPVDIG
jgi:signal transduction histidine kinase